jgi:dUTP pyrophosphatase
MDDSRAAVEVLIQRLPGNDLPLPARASEHASGFDLRACVEEPVTLAPGGRAVVPTGIAVAVPPGWEAQVRPRSGLAAARGLTMLNSPGTIDADYRGEVMLVAVNLGDRPVVIERGDRIAQMVIAPAPRAALREVSALPPTARGAGGFGHTGSR